MDWKDEISRAVLVDQRLRELDRQGLWPYHLPRVAASAHELRLAEQRIGHTLSPDHREFLRHANGWPGFYQAVTLFGTPELLPGQVQGVMAGQVEALADLEALPDPAVGADHCLVIAGSLTQPDIFLQEVEPSGRGRPVHWIAGSAVETFSDFTEFFLTVVDLNRRQIELFDASG